MTHRTRLALAALIVALGIGSLPLSWADELKADVEKDFPSKKVTLTGQMPLSEALAELKKQTGIEVEDRSETGCLRVKLNLKDVTFWQALEAIAKEADVRVAPVLGDKKAGLVPGPYKAMPISYYGPFRMAVKRITAVRDLESDAHYYAVNMEIAWEPGIRPFFQDSLPPVLEVTDDKGRLIKVDDEGRGRQPVGGRSSELTLRLGDIPRTTGRIGLIKGTVNLAGPTKWLQFEFGNLAEAKADPKKAEQKLEGVTAKLNKLAFDKDLWSVEMALDYPGDGPKLESFEIGDFVVFNECRLKNKKGDKLVADIGFETAGGSGSKTIVIYKFDPEGKPEDWGLTYKAPGPMREIPIKFEFKDLILP